MPWWLPLAIVGGAKATSQAIQNKRDRKERKRADKKNDSRQANYYTDLVRNSQRAGFNPLTVLRAGGGMGYSNLAGRITQPLMSVNPFSAGIDAAANFWASTYRTPHQKEMDKLNKEALRSDIDLSRAQTASLVKELQTQSVTGHSVIGAHENVSDIESEDIFKDGRSSEGFFQPLFSRTGLVKRKIKGEEYVQSSEAKAGWSTVVLSDGTVTAIPGEEVEPGWVLFYEGLNSLDKTFDFNGDRKFEYFSGKSEKYSKSKSVWDLSKIHGFLSNPIPKDWRDKVNEAQGF